MKNQKNASSNVVLSLSMLEFLAGELPSGMSKTDVAAALGCSSKQVHQSFKILQADGWMEMTQDGWIRVTPRFTRLAFRAQRKLDEISAEGAAK